MSLAGGYWAASDLAQIAPKAGSLSLLASQSPLNATDLQTMIVLSSARFDGAAGKAGYLVPIPSSSPSAFVFAQAIVKDGALGMAFDKVYTGPDGKFADKYKAAFEATLKLIADGDLPIPGAPNDPTSNSRLLTRSGGIASAVITASMGYPNDLQIPSDW